MYFCLKATQKTTWPQQSLLCYRKLVIQASASTAKQRVLRPQCGTKWQVICFHVLGYNFANCLSRDNPYGICRIWYGIYAAYRMAGRSQTRKHWLRILDRQHVYFSTCKWPDFNVSMTLAYYLTKTDLEPRTVVPGWSKPKPDKYHISFFKLLKFKESDLTSSIWVHLDYLNNTNAKNENIRKSFFDIRQFPTPEWPYFDASDNPIFDSRGKFKIN